MAAQRHGMWAAVGGMVAFSASWTSECAAQVAVFAPGTSQAYIDEVNAKLQATQAESQSGRFTLTTRWPDGGANGDPISLTYSLIPDGVILPDTIAGPKDPEGPSELFSKFDQKFEGLRSFWLFLIDANFEGTFIDSWGSVSGITFTRVTAPDDNTDPENPISFDWDDGSVWGTNGPLTGGTTTLGDIRIGAKFIDGIGGVFGYAFPPDHPTYPGEIVLDADEQWEDERFGYRRLINMLSHLVGIAIGLDLACPDDDTKVMEPMEDEQDLQGPQLDDIRGVNALYGDRFENNDLLETGSAQELVFDPVASLLGQQFNFNNLSIDQFADKDFFFVVIPPELGETVDIDVRIEAAPLGKLYPIGPDNGGGCGGVPTVQEDARIAQNLRVSLRDAAGVSVTSYVDASGDPIDADPAGYIDIADFGEDEIIIGNITVPGTYFIEISSSEGDVPADPQLYDLFVQVGNAIFSSGLPTDVVVANSPPFGLGSTFLTNQPDLGAVPPGRPTFTGKRSTIGQVDGLFPSMSHLSIITPDANTPNTRNFAQARIAWPGGLTSAPAIGDVSDAATGAQAIAIEHATIAASAALGNPEGVYPAGSIGPAFEASLIAASVATRVVPTGFLIEREALTYALFSLTHPTYAAAAGLPTTATVISNPFGFAGDLRGDTYISQLYDVIVYMNHVPVVAGTGNSGGVDETSQCGGAGGNVPGGDFRGSRTVTAPGTAANVIAVGAAAKPLPEDTPANPAFVNPAIDNISMVADISGKGPTDIYDYTNSLLVLNARTGPDLIAPGTGYVAVAKDPQELDPPAPPCSYAGHQSVIALTGPDLNPLFDADLDNPANPERYTGVTGTSLSAGYTAGTIALLQDYALAQDPPLSIAPVVLRAILLAAASPQLGWTNNQNPARPQDNRDGEESLLVDNDTGEVSLNETLYQKNGTRPLDYAQGAGVLNIENAYSIYRGAHASPVRAAFVPVVEGTETRDVFATDPTEPTITDPPRESADIAPDPFAGTATSLSTLSVEDLPPSPLKIQKQLFEGNTGISNNTVFQEHADFGDAKLDEVDPAKGAGGATFTGRPPFKLPSNPGGGRPGNPSPPAPTELDSKLVVGPIGWDHGMIGQRVMSLPAKQPAFPTAGALRTGYIDYFVSFPFDGTVTMQVALTWMRTAKMALPNFSDFDDPQIGQLTSLELENLDVQLIQCDSLGEILEDHVFLGQIGVDDGGQVWDGSNSLYSNVEFFSSKPDPGFYVIRVRWVGSTYDLFRNEVDGSTEFGLAWISDFYGGIGLPPEEEENAGALANAVSMAQSGKSASARVMGMLIKSMGSKAGDARFNRSFDIDRDGRITARDFFKVANFWAGR